MAVLGNVNNFNNMSRLVQRLWWHYDIIADPQTDMSNYIDSARVVVQTMLDLSNLLDIYSLPGDEWERVYELRRHCHWLEALLLIPTTEREEVLEGCIEAVGQYYYLLEMEDIQWASAIEMIETLCLRKSDTSWATTTTILSN